MFPKHGQLVGFALGHPSLIRSSFIVSSSVFARQKCPEERLAIGMAVMSLGLLHLQLFWAIGFGQVPIDAVRSAADAAPHLPDNADHLQEVHLAQSTLFFALVSHRLLI
jgi:hypothetical protein